MAAALAIPASAVADSPWIYASGDQCSGKWFSASNNFAIDDRDTNDDDYCYIEYSFESDHSPIAGRFNHPQDDPDPAYYHVTNPQGRATIYWHLCKERQNDNDICTGWRADRT